MAGEYTQGEMWFIGQFENGSWGFQQEGCPPRYTSQHEAETIKGMYEALKELREAEWMVTHDWGGDREEVLKKANEALAKAEGKEQE